MQQYSRRKFCISLSGLAAAAIISPVLSAKRVLSTYQTGYAYHPDFVLFENPQSSAETYLRAQWINSRLVLSGVSGDTLNIVPYADPMEYIKKIHTQSHIDTINSYSAGNRFTLTIGQVAQTAVGYVLGAVNDVCSGSIKNAFCCIRPPGHHVLNSGELGYCCYANIVLAARFAREKFNIRKILIIDWDFHRGNGTYDHICDDNDILFFETYSPEMWAAEWPGFKVVGPDHLFPDDARRINIKMPSGSTNDDFIRVFESKLVPAAERFQPELVLISCGFDLKKNDSHNQGVFNITANGISRLTRIVRQIADTYADGKLVSILEGGYADAPRDKSIFGATQTFSGLSQCAENHVKTLITGEEQPETPFYSSTAIIGMQPSSKQQITWKNGILSGLPVSEGPLSIIITDMNGRAAKKFEHISATSFTLPLNNLAPGRYTISVRGRQNFATRIIGVTL